MYPRSYKEYVEQYDRVADFVATVGADMHKEGFTDYHGLLFVAMMLSVMNDEQRKQVSNTADLLNMMR